MSHLRPGGWASLAALGGRRGAAGGGSGRGVLCRRRVRCCACSRAQRPCVGAMQALGLCICMRHRCMHGSCSVVGPYRADLVCGRHRWPASRGASREGLERQASPPAYPASLPYTRKETHVPPTRRVAGGTRQCSTPLLYHRANTRRIATLSAKRALAKAFPAVSDVRQAVHVRHGCQPEAGLHPSAVRCICRVN